MTTPTTVNLLERSLCREMFERWGGGDMLLGEKVSQYPLNQSMQHMDKWQINAAQQKLFVCLYLSVYYSVESVGSMGTMKSIGSQRVRHNWMTFTFIQYTILCIIIYSFFFFLQGSLREVISKLVSRMVILPLVILLPTFFGLVYLLVGHPCYLVTKLCPSLYYPMDCSLPDSSVRGISQARILEWVAISSSRGSSPPRDPTHISCVSCIGGWILYCWATYEAALEVLDSTNCIHGLPEHFEPNLWSAQSSGWDLLSV